ncbi:MAG TPA: hypothetical protein VF628_06950 [Allosphingosinicella sp.]|jgi:hypothetical protein
MARLDANTPYARVYQALDLALASGDRAVAPGTEAAVQAALYEIRNTGGPDAAVCALQTISVDLALLFTALRRGDAPEYHARRARLAAVKEEWLRLAPLH